MEDAKIIKLFLLKTILLLKIWDTGGTSILAILSSTDLKFGSCRAKQLKFKTVPAFFENFKIFQIVIFNTLAFKLKYLAVKYKQSGLSKKCWDVKHEIVINEE